MWLCDLLYQTQTHPEVQNQEGSKVTKNWLWERLPARCTLWITRHFGSLCHCSVFDLVLPMMLAGHLNCFALALGIARACCRLAACCCRIVNWVV
eukprot:2810651-Amphidinium_carterae.1